VEATATDAAGSNSYSLIILLELMNLEIMCVQKRFRATNCDNSLP
jgi:hypothetical protein